MSAEDVDSRMTSLLTENLPALRRFASMLAKRQDVAEDIVQQACLRAWIARVSFDETRPAKPWLFQILKNEFLQHVRRSAPQDSVTETMSEGLLGDSAGADKAIELLSLWKHLAVLPDNHRHALVLVVAVGMSYDEAAEAIGCSPGTIKSRVNRAKQKLRKAMGISASPDGAAEAGSSDSDVESLQIVERRNDETVCQAESVRIAV